MHRLLAEQQIPLAGVRIVDGSGLSRLDRLTAASVVGMLQSSWLDEDLREILISSLPVAGPERDARRTDARNGGSGSGPGEDRNAERGLGAVRLREAPLRVLGHPERVAGVALLGAHGRRTASRRS